MVHGGLRGSPATRRHAFGDTDYNICQVRTPRPRGQSRSAAPRPALLGGQTPALAVMYDTAFGEQRHFKNLIWSGSQRP